MSLATSSCSLIPVTTSTATFPLTDNTYYLDGDSLAIARQCASGSYQQDLVEGRARWSGADLEGAARQWGGRYSGSRRSLLRKMRAAGLTLVWVTASHGRRVH